MDTNAIYYLNILTCHPGGFMEQLDGRWILVKDAKCPEKDTSPATLGLTNMAGKWTCSLMLNAIMYVRCQVKYNRFRLFILTKVTV